MVWKLKKVLDTRGSPWTDEAWCRSNFSVAVAWVREAIYAVTPPAPPPATEDATYDAVFLLDRLPDLHVAALERTLGVLDQSGISIGPWDGSELPRCAAYVITSADSYGGALAWEPHHLCCELTLEVAVGLMVGANIVGPHWVLASEARRQLSTDDLIERISWFSRPAPVSATRAERCSESTLALPIVSPDAASAETSPRRHQEPLC